MISAVLNISRYLSPEPMLQTPGYMTTMAAAGMQVPTYAYAANNPLRYVDPTGREVNLYGTQARVSAARMELISLAVTPGTVGAQTQALIADPNFKVDVFTDVDVVAEVGGITLHPEGLTLPTTSGAMIQLSLGVGGDRFRRNFAHETGHASAMRSCGGGSIFKAYDFLHDRFRRRSFNFQIAQMGETFETSSGARLFDLEGLDLFHSGVGPGWADGFLWAP